MTNTKLLEYLRAKRTHRAPDILVEMPINPDGEEAAALIEQQEAVIASLVEALTPFADVADHDIGLDEADSDTFRPMTNYNRAAKITVGDMRRALSVLEAKSHLGG